MVFFDGKSLQIGYWCVKFLIWEFYEEEFYDKIDRF